MLAVMRRTSFAQWPCSIARTMDLLGDWWTPLVLATTLIGTEDMVRERLRVWRDVGVDTVRFYPAGETLDARLATLGRAVDLVRDLDRDEVAR